jgi:hypothetical protein
MLLFSKITLLLAILPRWQTGDIMRHDLSSAKIRRWVDKISINKGFELKATSSTYTIGLPV